MFKIYHTIQKQNPFMNATTSVKVLTGLLLTALAACSTQNLKQDTETATPADKSPAMARPAPSGQNPQLNITKNGKTLNLVRIMDGAACKNDFEGVKGVFLLYADPNDIERIKREKGTKVFSEFETKIQELSEDVLQEALNLTNLAKDPFAIGDDVAQQKLAGQLATNFHNAATDAINEFEKETTLTIDVMAFPPSLIFYQQGCQPTLLEPDSPEGSGYQQGD